MSRKKKTTPKKKRQKPRVISLVFMGLVGAIFGLVMVLKPIAYINPGGLGRYGINGPMTVFNASDASFVGWMIFACGSFCLYLAYRVRNG